MNTLSRFAAIVLIIPVVGLTLAGCSKKLTGDVTTGAKLSFKINVDTWLGYAPLYLAKEKGFFGNADVSIDVSPDVAVRKTGIKSGNFQAIAETVDMLVLDRDEGVPTVAVSGMDFSNGADGIVAVDAVKTLQDLKGKTVLVQKNYASEALLNYLLEKNGIAFADVHTVDTEAGAAGAAFVAGKTDVAVTFEPWLSKAKDRGNGHILISSKDAPGVIVDILSIQKDYLTAHPEVVRDVVNGWFKAVEYWRAHTEESNAIMAKYYSDTPAEFADQISGIKWPTYEENVSYFTKGSTPSIYDTANTFVEIYKKTGQTQNDFDLDPAIDGSILQSLHASK